jgi:hypothetical protein
MPLSKAANVSHIRWRNVSQICCRTTARLPGADRLSEFVDGDYDGVGSCGCQVVGVAGLVRKPDARRSDSSGCLNVGDLVTEVGTTAR